MSDVNDFNAENNEFVLRDYSPEEIEQREIELNANIEQDVISIELDSVTTSAINKLKSLGFSEQEAKNVIGI